MASDPTTNQQLLAGAALLPFVRAWRLPLNPEDLELMAFAVLRHAAQDLEPTPALYAAIDDDVGALIEEHTAAHDAMAEAMRRATEDRG